MSPRKKVRRVMPTKKDIGKYVFWSYDYYPYILGAKILNIRKDQLPVSLKTVTIVSLEGYGEFWDYEHFLLISRDPAIQQTIRDLRSEDYQARNNLQVSMLEKAIGLLPASLTKYCNYLLNEQTDDE